ncbi:MAG: hypothetical protein AAGF85_03125 [Bacteroidota bacterium]
MKKRLCAWMVVLVTFYACSTTTADQTTPPVVTAIYPSSDTLPANLLRMYLHFSKPMKTIGNLENIKLLDENGLEIAGAIFNNVHELWDNEQQQLTLIFDPSRVKTGLNANERLGRAIQVGKQYQLVIDGLEDVEGYQLKETFIKPIFGGPVDTLPPNTEKWKLKIPTAGSRSPLIVQFPAMLDQHSLLQRLQLTNTSNVPIKGEINIVNQEKEWRLMANAPWLAGDYILYVHGRLEDPAGNNLNGLFDHKIGSLKNAQEGLIETINITIKK